MMGDETKFHNPDFFMVPPKMAMPHQNHSNLSCGWETAASSTGSSRDAAVAMVIVHPRGANADNVDAVHVEVG